MIKYITDLHLVGLPFIDEPTMENVHKIVNKGDILIIGGDIFNSYAVGASNSTFYDHIIKLSEICEHIYLLTGNHDDNQGVCSFRLFDYAKDNVSIIPDYQVVKIDDVNYHFLNHFRHYPKFNNLILEGTNILFSHAEINNESEIPKSFLKFDRVYNGHIHDFGSFGNVVNTGAFRQTKKNESTLRHYLEIDGASYIKYDVKTPVVVKEVLFSDMDALVDEPSMIKVIVKSKEERERFHKLKDVYKNIHFKVESHINPEIQVSAVKQEVKNGLDVKDVFKEYYKEFCAKFDFKTDVKKTDLFTLFAKVCGEVKDSEILDFKIDSLYLKNFKLFEELSLDFMQNKAGLTLVKGINNDEIVDGRVSSNESGKTVIRQAIEYALVGAEAKVTPLRNGESSGEVYFGFSVKGDSVRFMRSFTEKKNDLRISINKEEFGKDMTMTEKLDAFFEKYPVNKYMDFILLYSRDWVGNFFNPKSNQKAKILAEMFPNLLSIPGKVVKDIQVKTKTLQDSYNMQLQAYESKKLERNLASKSFRYNRKSIQDNIIRCANNAQECQEKIDTEPIIEKPKFTMDVLNSYRKYLSATPVVSPYGHTSEIDINNAFEKIKAHEMYLKKNLLLESIGTNIKYVEPYLKGELKKDTSELSRQSAILSNKITEERNRYEREFNKLSSAGVCHTCGSIPSVEKQQEIKAEIEKELLRIKEYGLSLAKELSEKESVLKEIESYNANFEVVYKELSKYDRNQLQLLTAEVEKDEEFEKHKWEKENGYAFNNWLKLNEERHKMSIPADINIDKEVENIAAYNNRAFKISNYESMINKYMTDIAKLNSDYDCIRAEVVSLNNKTREALKANTKDAVLEELKVAKVLSEVLSSKKTLNFENYFVSMFLEKVQSIITTFLSMLFTREVYLEVTDCDLQFFDEGKVRTYNDFSKGARTKIEIALVLALGLIQMDYGFSTNFMFIDEFLDEGVDETNIKRVVELLRRCYSEVDHLYLVSHKQIEDIVDHTLLINRQGGKSTCLY